jgi:hypothetical protein
VSVVSYREPFDPTCFNGLIYFHIDHTVTVGPSLPQAGARLALSNALPQHPYLAAVSVLDGLSPRLADISFRIAGQPGQPLSLQACTALRLAAETILDKTVAEVVYAHLLGVVTRLIKIDHKLLSVHIVPPTQLADATLEVVSKAGPARSTAHAA